MITKFVKNHSKFLTDLFRCWEKEIEPDEHDIAGYLEAIQRVIPKAIVVCNLPFGFTTEIDEKYVFFMFKRVGDFVDIEAVLSKKPEAAIECIATPKVITSASLKIIKKERPVKSKRPKKVDKSEKVKKTHNENSEMISLNELCDDQFVSTSSARRKLRAAGIEKPGKSWSWARDSEEVEKISEIIS